MKNDDAYANAPYVEGAEGYLTAWDNDAAAFRTSMLQSGRAQLGLSYGPHDRQAMDVFLPQSDPKGLCVFVHGGYWLQLHRHQWSHFADGMLARGYVVAMPSYILAPEASIPDITAMVAMAINHAAGQFYGPIFLTGHSAGGHLVARMATGGAGLHPDVAVRVQRIVPISPLTDLHPFMETTMNQDLNIDVKIAHAESPALHPQALDTDVHIWIGADERPAFLDHARRLSQAWKVPFTIQNERHHYNIIDDLKSPRSALLDDLLRT